MTPMRLAALAFVALPLVGCHDDPEEVILVEHSTSGPLAINACGGAATATSGALGTGGQGGGIRAFAFGDVLVGADGTPLSIPEIPKVPPTGGVTPTTSTTGVSVPGLVFINGTVTTTADATYESTSGDVFVSGAALLRAGDNGGGQFNITLNAPNGTVFVNGTVRTGSNDNSNTGDSAGTLTITASRIVIRGTLDARGENNSAGSGGDGGTVTLDTTGSVGAGSIFFPDGLIQTTGGNGASNGAAVPLLGGAGGAVILNAAGQIHAFAPITTTGGQATDGTATALVTGGAGGSVTLSGGAGIDFSDILTLQGGKATGGSAGATGGAGGVLTSDSLSTARIYGTITAPGGAAAGDGGTITGGTGGGLSIGQVTGTERVELGNGTFSVCGGTGEGSGGDAGDIEFRSTNGAILCRSFLDARGGAGAGPGPADGGRGGSVHLIADQDFLTGVNASNHTLTLLAEGKIDGSGGAAVGAGAGGGTRDVTLQCGGDLLSEGTLLLNGGSSFSGTGGTGNLMTFTIAAANGAPNGTLTVGGKLTAEGGSAPNGTGGDGTTVTLDAAASALGEIVSTADITTNGGDSGGANPGGQAGDIDLFASGDVTVTRTWKLDGGSCSGPGSGFRGARARILNTGHAVTLGVDIFARGGNCALGTAGDGGRVLVHTDAGGIGLGGPITLQSGGSINVSAGTGATGGSAASDLAAGVSDPAADDTLMAVIFDADGPLGDSAVDSDPGGIVVQLGRITATGSGAAGRGGDIFFDGRDESGATATNPVAGPQTLTGTSLAGSFRGD